MNSTRTIASTIARSRTCKIAPNQFKHLLATSKNLKFLGAITPNGQFRSVASPKKINNPGLLDSLVGEYEDPNYLLDNKGEEWREGQYFYFFSEFGVMILCVPTITAICLCFSMLAWYTFFDSQSQLSRTNPHGCLGLNSGADLDKVRNPILMWLYPYGGHQDRKVHFYYELQDAIDRKKKMVAEGKFH